MSERHDGRCPSLQELGALMSLGLMSGDPMQVPDSGPEEASLHSMVGPELESCPQCQRQVTVLERWMDETYFPDPAMVAEEVPRAEALWQEISDLTGEALAAALDRRFKFWAMVTLLIEKSSEAVHHSTDRSLELAEAGVDVAYHLNGGVYPPRLLMNLRALAAAARGNSRRMKFDLDGADRELHRAVKLALKGSGAPQVRARILHLLGSLRRDQRRLQDSQRVLKQARDLYEEVGRYKDVGRVCLNLAVVLGMSDDRDGSINYLTYAQQVISRKEQPVLFATCQHNLVANLIETEQFEEASLRIGGVKKLWRVLEKNRFLAQAFWAEGKIHFGLGEFEDAETAFTKASDAFDQQKSYFHWAMVQLDMTLLYLEQRDFDSLKSVATDAFTIFRGKKIYSEAAVALLCLKEAAEAEAVTKALVAEITAFLGAVQGEPKLRFRRTTSN